jgi:gamma-glutamyltranspeptidase/glutathione hydrolase
VNGYYLNNELTDFNIAPDRDGVPTANRVEGGKRPRSSMSPTIVLTRRPFLALARRVAQRPSRPSCVIPVNRLARADPARGGGRGLGEATPRRCRPNRASPPTRSRAALGHVFAANPEIGAATAVEFLPDGCISRPPSDPAGGGAAGWSSCSAACRRLALAARAAGPWRAGTGRPRVRGEPQDRRRWFGESCLSRLT